MVYIWYIYGIYGMVYMVYIYIYIYGIYIYKVLSDERLGAKLRVTENRCVLFNLSIYV